MTKRSDTEGVQATVRNGTVAALTGWEGLNSRILYSNRSAIVERDGHREVFTIGEFLFLYAKRTMLESGGPR
ncbi:MAG: hypothetical protein AAF394_09000, partial [Planctomycetota bacterium]